MRKFVFRLEKVLDYRRLTEEWAKDAYLFAQAARLDADAALAAICEGRVAMLAMPVLGLQERLGLEAMLERLDGEEAMQRRVIVDLIEDEERSLEEWIERRRDVEVLVKLREREHQAWLLESARREQAALDEWAVLRRAA